MIIYAAKLDKWLMVFAVSWLERNTSALSLKCCCFCFSHLMGMFYRTIRMVDNGIKPVYVFDGKPPDMKSGEVSSTFLTHKKRSFNLFIYLFFISVLITNSTLNLKSKTHLSCELCM